MNELLATLFGYGMPIGAIMLISLAAVICMVVALVCPRYIVLGYVAILLLFPNSSSYGMLEGETNQIIYVKGTRTFFFSFLDMMIFGTWLLAVAYGRLWQRVREPMIPLSKYYLIFAMLFLGHVAAGMLDPKHFTLLDFSGSGVINVLWQGMFISLLLMTIRSERDLRTLLWVMLICTAGREAFGLVRYAFLGGDPQNAYANLEGLNIKITFWDINDSIIAALVVGFCGWKLLAERVKGWEGLAYSALGLMALLIPLLSSRRTAQGGLLLAMGVLLFLLPRGRRWPIILAIIVMAPLAAVLTSQRSHGSGSFVQKILLDVKISEVSDPRRSRFHELITAWQTVRESPVFGLGPAGEFRVTDRTGLEYHRGRYDYVHSGFGHILLKTGFVGLFIFCGLFVVYLRQLRICWGRVPPHWRALAVGSVCAFAAQLPNMLFGTPIGEIRTMQLLGLLLAIPFVLSAIFRKAEPSAQVRPSPKFSGYTSVSMGRR